VTLNLAETSLAKSRPSFLQGANLSFFMLSFLLIYFLTGLLPDLHIYSFQNRPISFSGRGL